MAITLGDVVVLIHGKIDGLQKDIDEAKRVSSQGGDQAGKAFAEKFGKQVSKVLSGPALAGTIIGVGSALMKMAADAAPLKSIGDAFAGIADNADLMLSKLRAGSLGMVTDAELMRSYNQAAQLVSKTFADQLPSAMGYLAKVSAATGESMDYMMNSLVVGVGRTNPRILDNLSVQVDATAASAAYAASLGVQVDQLSKAQQQTALFNQVMQKLAENTAAMPNVMGSATQQLASLSTGFQNLKDGIGLAFLPVLQQLLTPLSQLASAAIPMVLQGVQSLASFVSANLVPVLAGVAALVTGLLLPTFLSIAPALGSVVLGAASAFASVILPAIAMAAAVVAVVKLIQTAWAENWMGIQQVTANVWAGIRGVIESAMNALIGVVGSATNQIAAWWANNWGLIQQTAAGAMNIVRSIVDSVLRGIVGFWQAYGGQILAVAKVVWGNVQLVISTVLTLIGGIIRTVLQLINGDWTGAWNTVQQTAEKVWTAIERIIADALTGIFGVVDGALRVLSTIFAEVFAWIQNSVIGQFVSSLTEHVRSIVARIADMAAAFPWLERIVGPAIDGVQRTLNGLGKATGDVAVAVIGEFAGMAGAVREWAETHKTAASVSIASLRQYEDAQAAATGGWKIPEFKLPEFKWPEFAAPDFGGAGAGAESGGLGGAVKEAVTKTAEEVMAAIAKTMEDLVNAIAGTMETLSAKLPELPTDVIKTWFDKFLGLVQDVATWMTQAGPEFVAFITDFKSRLLPSLGEWLESSRTLGDLFSSIKSVYDGLSEKLPDAKASVAEMFNALGSLFADVNAYVGRVQGGGLVAVTIPFKALDKQIVEWVASLKAGAEALAGTLVSARSVLDALVDKLPASDTLKTSVAEIFDRISGIFDQVREYAAGMSFGAGGLVSAPDTILAPLAANLVAWLVSVGESLKPLLDVLGSLKSLMDTIASRVVITQNSVRMFMQNALMMLETMVTQFSEKESAFDAASASLLELKPLFDGLVAAMGPMMAAMEPIMAMMDMVGKRLGIVRMDIENFLNSVLGALVRIGTWGKNNGWAMQEAIYNFEKYAKANLVALGTALLSASGVLNDALTAAQQMGQGIGPLREGIGQTIDGLLDIQTLMKNFNENDEMTAFGDVVGDFTKAVVDALTILSTGFAGETGLEEGMLSELIRKLGEFIEQVKNPFMVLYTWLSKEYKRLLGGITLGPEGQKIGKSLADGLWAQVPAVAAAARALLEAASTGLATGKSNAAKMINSVGVLLGSSLMDGANKGAGVASPSKPMIALADNIKNTLVSTLKAAVPEVEDAGAMLGKAIETGVRDALGMHSLSDVGIAMGKNFAASMDQGLQYDTFDPSTRLITGSSIPGNVGKYGYGGQYFQSQSQLQWYLDKLSGAVSRMQQPVTIAPQISIALSGPTFLQSERDMQNLSKKLTPYISQELARDASLAERYGLDVSK